MCTFTGDGSLVTSGCNVAIQCDRSSNNKREGACIYYRVSP